MARKKKFNDYDPEVDLEPWEEEELPEFESDPRDEDFWLDADIELDFE